MPWNFNFCSPHIPNDPVITLHRRLQIASLIGLLIFYMLLHMYLKFYGPGTEACQKQTSSQSIHDMNIDDQKSVGDQNSKNSDQNSDDKSISVGSENGNSSYVTFNTKEKNDSQKDEKSKQVSVLNTKTVTLEQVQSFFPIVYGHFSIAVAASLMYSPYAEQTLACFLYDLLAIILVYTNWKRKVYGYRITWGIMSLLISFLLLSTLLEVGQANYNKVTNECFSVAYKSLY